MQLIFQLLGSTLNMSALIAHNEQLLAHFLQRFRNRGNGCFDDVHQFFIGGSQFAQQAVIDTFVSKIFLFDDKVVIGFNYKDGEATINFDDVKNLVDQGLTGSDLDWSGAPTRMIRTQSSFQQETGSDYLLYLKSMRIRTFGMGLSSALIPS